MSLWSWGKKVDLQPTECAGGSVCRIQGRGLPEEGAMVVPLTGASREEALLGTGDKSHIADVLTRLASAFLLENLPCGARRPTLMLTFYLVDCREDVRVLGARVCVYFQ